MNPTPPALRLCALALVVVFTAGCTTLGYYHQSIRGHLSLMSKRQDIAELVAERETARTLRQSLERVLEMREFASTELALPDNGSYRSYVDIGRRFVLWNVVATEEFSVRPKTWCFPVTGCVSYRGYYANSDAVAFADALRAQGHDVLVSGVRAYSTLGWFDDPVLSSMLSQREHYLAGVIFHELSHQRLYIKDDTAFNEAFAVAVEREGVRRWFLASGATDRLSAYELERSRETEFIVLVRRARDRLEALYAKALAPEYKRAEKARIFAELRSDYEAQPSRFGRDYEKWLSEDLNNAKLALIATYHDQVPAFERLLAEHGRDLRAFYDAADEIGRLPRDERLRRLNE